MTFKAFLAEDRFNRQLLWLAGIAIIVQLIVFKILYPYAGFIDGDSYVYLQSAFYNLDINFYPIGYSKFLRLFSIFTKSDTALVAFQYLAIEVSALWFLFTLFYLYPLNKAAKWSMCIFVVFNPVFLYVSNYVSSDAFFLALSLTWIHSPLVAPSSTHFKAHRAAVACVARGIYGPVYCPLLPIHQHPGPSRFKTTLAAQIGWYRRDFPPGRSVCSLHSRSIQKA